jgi:calcineurin-like phosphoesterase family protein
MALFFTSDTHFGDAPRLRVDKRPFASVTEMDRILVERWNETVAPDDEVWHLGDFAGDAGRAYCAEIFSRLAGIKRLIVGNHDTKRVLGLAWADPPAPSARITVRDGAIEYRLFLSHYAHRAWPGLWRGTRHLYGHSHGSLADTSRSCDVGVDAWGYRPVRIDAIVARQEAAEVLPEELQRDGGLRPSSRAGSA